MKKLILLLCVVLSFSASHAQDSTLKEYTGSYKFPEGSMLPSAEVALKDTVLTVSSAQGSSDLAKRGRDTFALLSYDGTVYFRRDSTGKVAGVKVEVGDVLLEGTKDSTSAAAPQKQPAEARKQRQ